nr:protein psiD-like [Lytechinus pictus]
MNGQQLNFTISTYDFSVSHEDFARASPLPTYNSPKYVRDIFSGAWLRVSDDPEEDMFSSWFKTDPEVNVALTSRLTAWWYPDESLYRSWNESYFPIDELGFGHEDLSDCDGAFHNFGFTSVLRSSFHHSGQEVITLGGGEEMWLFLDGHLIMEIINHNFHQIICKKAELENNDGM